MKSSLNYIIIRYKKYKPTMEQPLEPSAVVSEEETLSDIKVKLLYAPNTNHAFLFESLDLYSLSHISNESYSKEKVIEIFMNYVNSKSLLDKKGKYITQSDQPLSKIIKCIYIIYLALGKSGKVLLDDALKEYLKSYKNFLSIETITSGIVTKNYLLKLTETPLITLTAQRMCNKKVTLICGAEKIRLDIENFVKYLRIKLATSGTVHDSKVYSDKEIMMQGKRLDDIKKIFMEKFELPEDQIKIIDKIIDKKKKRPRTHKEEGKEAGKGHDA